MMQQASQLLQMQLKLRLLNLIFIFYEIQNLPLNLSLTADFCLQDNRLSCKQKNNIAKIIRFRMNIFLNLDINILLIIYD